MHIPKMYDEPDAVVMHAHGVMAALESNGQTEMAQLIRERQKQDK